MPPILPNGEELTYTLVNRYILHNPLEGSNLGRCIHIESHQEYVYMIVENDSYQDLLRLYTRLESHPYVNPFKEVIVSSLRTFIVCERNYGDLLSYLRDKQKIPESEGLPLFKQMASAVASCHDKGVILRDLRLSKFVFKDPEKTQIIFESLHNAVVFEGDNDWREDRKVNPNYTSPEFLHNRNDRYRGRATDCWCLGIMLYAMLVGCFPFHHADFNVTASKIMSGYFYLPEDLSSEAEYLIIRLLRTNPSRRFTARGAFNYVCFGSEMLSENDEQIVPAQKCMLSVGHARFPGDVSKDDQIVPR